MGSEVYFRVFFVVSDNFNIQLKPVTEERVNSFKYVWSFGIIFYNHKKGLVWVPVLEMNSIMFKLYLLYFVLLS